MRVFGPSHYTTFASKVGKADALFVAGDETAEVYFRSTLADLEQHFDESHYLMQAMREIATKNDLTADSR